MDVVVNDAGYRFGPLLSHAYGRTVGGKCTATPACTPGDRARAVWSPHAPDALVGFDVSTSRLLFPSAITGGVPWIGGLRVARHAWPDMHAETLEDILVARGMAEEAQAISDKGAELDASREVLGMAHLTRDMLSAIDVRCSGGARAALMICAAEEAPRVLLRRVPADTNALQEAA